MKLIRILRWSSAFCLSAIIVQAQETNQIEQLKKQLQEVQENFEKVQRQQREQIEALTKQLNELIQQQKAATEQKKLEQQLAGELATNQPPATPSAAAMTPAPWSPSQPITVARGASSYLNLSFDALFAVGTSTAPTTDDVEALEFGGHDPKQRGFTVQNLEMTLDGKVDPYFRGQANIILQIDPDGETTTEVEEAFLETLSLPWNLQVKAGQYFTQFGRINPTHPHTWDFVDQPLVIGRFLGPDGLRNPGAQISWLVPTPFYSELFMSVQNSQGETAFSFRDSDGTELITQRPSVSTDVKNLGDMLYAPRYAMSFDLGNEHTVVLGASGAFGPNASGQGGETQIYGTDLFYKWKSRHHDKGFPFVTWQSEWLDSHYRAVSFPGDASNPPAPGETIDNWGIYSQVSYGFYPRWVGSLRGDYVTGQSGDFWTDSLLEDRYRISPALTFYPSEFSKLRLQYNYDHIEHTGSESSVWLQFEFLLGAHSAHKF